MKSGVAIAIPFAVAYAILSSACSNGNGSTVGGEDGSADVVVDVKPARDAGDACAVQAGAPACSDITTALPFPDRFTAPVAHQGVCTSTQVSDYLTNCFGFVLEQDAATCSDFFAANAPCAVCMTGASLSDAGDDASIPVPAILRISEPDGVVSVQTEACAAALLSPDPSCKRDVARLDYCVQTACSTCDLSDTAGLTACTNIEKGPAFPPGPCSPGESTCGSLIPLEAGCDFPPIPPQCGGGESTFEDQATSVIMTLCGP